MSETQDTAEPTDDTQDVIEAGEEQAETVAEEQPAVTEETVGEADPSEADAPDTEAAAETDEDSAGDDAVPDTEEEAEEPEPEDYELPIPEEELALRVEAAVLTSDRALTPSKLGKLLGDIPTRYIREAVDALNEHYDQTGRSFRIEKVAGGYRVMTLPAYADVLKPVHRARVQAKLSPAAMETLAIVAYKQPVIRAEIEAIRGVASGEVLRALMERHLVKVVGRAEEIGRPMLYGTTKAFLETFGLADLKDLPKVEQLKPGG